MEEQEKEFISSRPIAAKWGAISGVIGIISFLIQDFADMRQDPIFIGVGLVIMIALIFMAHSEYKREGDGFMDYGQGVGMGFWYGLVSSTISSIFTFVYVKFINPGFLDSIREQQIMDMEERGMSEAQIEQALKMSESFSGPTAMLVMGIIIGVIFSLIVALIVSAFTKKSRPDFE